MMTDFFLTQVRAYLQEAFTSSVETLNSRYPDLGLQDIASWSSGFTGVSAGLQAYPGCLTLVSSKTIDTRDFTTFSLTIGIGVTSDDSERLELLGGIWEDILEDAIRADSSLGGSCVTADQVSITSDCVSHVYLIEAKLECAFDRTAWKKTAEEAALAAIAGSGEKEDGSDQEKKDENGEVVPMPEVSSGDGPIPSGEGSGVLSPLSDDYDGNLQRGGEEETFVWVNNLGERNGSNGR